MSEPKYRLQISDSKLNGRLGFEAVVSVFQGKDLVEENLVNLSNKEKREAFALLISERFAIDQVETQLLRLMHIDRNALPVAQGVLAAK